MAYENLKLSVAYVSNTIYLSKILKNGNMSEIKKNITDECIRATATHLEHSWKTDKSPGVRWEHGGTLTFVPDEFTQSFDEWRKSVGFVR